MYRSAYRSICFFLFCLSGLKLKQVRYSRLLEEGDFRGRPANYIWMLLFGIFNISIVASYHNVHFLGSALTFMMAYVWVRNNLSSSLLAYYLPLYHALISDARTCSFICFKQGRRNEDVKMSFLGFLQFNAPYLPWVMLTFSILIGNAVVMDLIGICVGHGYYFLEFVYPVLADIRGWPVKRVMEPPTVLHMLCGTHRPEQQVQLHQD